MGQKTGQGWHFGSFANYCIEQFMTMKTHKYYGAFF